MDAVYHVFRQIEPPDFCPPNVQKELVSEIDLIRNSLILFETTMDDFFGMTAAFLASIPLPSQQTENKQST